MSFLVTGGAGYIGAHIVRAMRVDGLDVVVVDDLSSGHRAFVPEDVEFVEGTILDTPLLTEAMHDCAVTGVIHLAGFKYAGVSMQRPLHTFEQNVSGTASVLAAMRKAGVASIVFSSSAAVYGTPSTDVVTEDTETRPESPYGQSKLVGEWLVAAAARAHGPQRNVGGAAGDIDEAKGPLRSRRVEHGHELGLPQPVEPTRHEVVHEIVAAGDGREDLVDETLALLLSDGAEAEGRAAARSGGLGHGLEP